MFICNQLLFATTIATALATLGMMPKWMRTSRLNGLLLCVLVALAGGISCCYLQSFWPLLVVTLPLCVWLLSQWGIWQPWASIYAACVCQNALIYLVYLGGTVWTSSGIAAIVIGTIIWAAQAGSVLVTCDFAVQQVSLCNTASGLCSTAYLFCKTAGLTEAFVWLAAKKHKMEEIMPLSPAMGRPGKAFVSVLSRSLSVR